MRGNDREIQRHRMEDALIRRVDNRRVIKTPKVEGPGLRVSLMELIAYKAAATGAPIRWGSLNINVRPA